jgi:dienelactone hydrolase
MAGRPQPRLRQWHSPAAHANMLSGRRTMQNKGQSLAQRTNAAAPGGLDPGHVVITEPVQGSDIPVHLMYIEMIDGVYAPIGLRKPHGAGAFPLVLFASGNGGGGMAWVREATQNRSWTQEQFLAAGYAVAWMRYRAEVDYAYDRIGRLIEDRRQNRQLLNRGPLEYEDVISIVEYVKTLPFVAPNRIGYMGMSHGGEMAFKIASEYRGIAAMIASEPAAHEFLRLRPDATARINPATGLLDVERMLMREVEKVRPRITEDVARERISTIQTPIFVQGRNSDELQGIFRVCYDLLAETGKTAKWKTYEHDVHGFVYVQRHRDGAYRPDPVQIEAVRDSIAFFDEYLKAD